jgi:CRISPR-associated endonuclease Cas1
VVLGHAGTVSLEALRWLGDVGVAFVALEPDGRVLAASGSAGIDDARLRRAQALAASNEVGLTIARHLLGAKLRAQADVLATVVNLGRGAAGFAPTVTGLAGALDDARTIDECRQLEATAAARYWSCWEGVTMRFATRHGRPAPAQWTGPFEGRRSVLGAGSARNAIHPVNALLNYLCALASAECRLAALAVGLDPGIGFVHADVPARDSAALDLVEPVRPHIERYVLRLLSERTFRASDFAEMGNGTCRVLAPLTHDLASTMSTWARIVAPHAEAVARVLAGAAVGKVTSSTPLTRANHRHRQGDRPVPAPAPQLPGLGAPTCRGCGDPIRRRQVWCDDCWPVARQAAARKASQAAAGSPRRALTPDERSRQSQAIAAAATRRRDRAIATDAPGWTTEAFRELVVPGLAAVELRAIIGATGLSRSSASLIRSGQRTPRPQHWPALARLASVTPEGGRASR